MHSSVDGQSDDSASIDGGEQPSICLRPRKRARACCRAQGDPHVHLLVADPKGYNKRLGRDDQFEPGLGRHLACVGIAAWELLSAQEAASRGHASLDALLRIAMSRSSKAPTAFLVYRLRSLARLQDPIELADDASPSSVLAGARMAGVVDGGYWQTEGSSHMHVLDDYVDHWCSAFDRPLRSVVSVFICSGSLGKVWAGDSYFHAVALAVGIRFWKHVLSPTPSKKFCRNFASSQLPMQGRPGRQLRSEGAAPIKNSLPVCALLELIEATRTLKKLRDAPQAKHAWAKVFARETGIPIADLLAKDSSLCYECLRRGRIRLDSVAMLLWRRWFASIDLEDINLYLFVDGSPQWRGRELFAVSFDMIQHKNGDKQMVRRLCPVLQLGRDVMSAAGKLLALLWMLFLLVGPNPSRYMKVLERIRSITSDLGTERKMAHMNDMAPEFWKFLGCRPADVLRREWMFPRALQAPGWSHIWDNLIRLGLSSLHWFPGFLAALKALLSILRDNREDMIDALRRMGRSQVAVLLNAVKLPYFAAWRWGTLHDVCEQIGSVLQTLRMHWPQLDFLKQLRDQKKIALAKICIEQVDWDAQFRFVQWYGRWLTTALRWGGSCLCHQEEFDDGVLVQCDEKGRLVTQSYQYAEACFADGLAVSQQWSEVQFHGLPASFLAELRGAVGLVVGVGRKKLAFLDRIPFLIARIDEPEVRPRILQQWEEAAEADRDAVSAEFLEEGSPLRRQIDRMIPEQCVLEPELMQEVQSLRDIPFIDVVCEGPHAAAHRVGLGSRAARWAWIASSIRVQQNLADAQRLAAETGADMQKLWNKWKSVIQTSKRSANRNSKIRHHVFYDQLYRMSSMKEFGSHLAEAGGAPGVDGEDDDDDVVADEEETPAVAELPGGTFTSSLNEFLDDACAAHSYITVPAAEGSDVALKCFQVLHKRRKHILPEGKTHRAVEQADEWCIQAMEIWRGHAAAVDSTRLDVFALCGPSNQLAAVLFGITAAQRSMVKVWTPEQSDLQGCISLQSPAPVCSRKMLNDKNIPVLCLADALQAKGFHEKHELVVHKPASLALHYDCRHLSSKRSYLQAVLAQDQLFAKGVTEFQSGKAAAYYQWLLRSPGLIEEGLSAKEMQELIKKAGETALQKLPALQMSARPLGDSAVLADPDVDGGCAALVDEDVDGGEPAMRAKERKPSTSSSSSSSSDSCNKSSSKSTSSSAADLDSGSIEGDEGEDRAAGAPIFVEGCKLTPEREGEAGAGYRVRCPHHSLCRCFKSAHVDADIFGALAPVFFLGAWVKQGADMPAEEHRTWRPGRRDVRAFADSWSAGD